MSIEEELRILIERNYAKLLDQLATVTRGQSLPRLAADGGRRHLIQAAGFLRQFRALPHPAR